MEVDDFVNVWLLSWKKGFNMATPLYLCQKSSKDKDIVIYFILLLNNRPCYKCYYAVNRQWWLLLWKLVIDVQLMYLIGTTESGSHMFF